MLELELTARHMHKLTQLANRGLAVEASRSGPTTNCGACSVSERQHQKPRLFNSRHTFSSSPRSEAADILLDA